MTIIIYSTWFFIKTFCSYIIFQELWTPLTMASVNCHLNYRLKKSTPPPDCLKADEGVKKAQGEK